MMLNDCLALVIVMQDQCGEVFTQQVDGGAVGRYVDDLIDIARSYGESDERVFCLGFAAAIDAVAGGMIGFSAPLIDSSCAFGDVMVARGDDALRTDAARGGGSACR